VPNSSANTRSPTALGGVGLTDRQRDVLALLLQGKSNKAICRELDLAPTTVKNHVTAILRALDVTSRAEAIVKARGLGQGGDAWQSGPPLPDIPSIVVLPFANLSGDADQDYFADGMVDEITTAVGRVPRLFVIASSSAFAYKNSVVDSKQIGSELGVRYILGGSVRREANAIRVVAHLSDATVGSQIWASRFDGSYDNVFELQDRVAASVSANIVPAVRAIETTHARRKPTGNLSAYDLYLRALPPRRDTFDQNQESLRLLYKAIELDPEFGAAYALAAYCHQMQVVFTWQTPPAHWIKEGVRLAHAAAEKGDSDPEALWMAGRALATLAGETDRGLALIEKSISINPNSARAWWGSGITNTMRGNTAAAFDHFARARRLNPLDAADHAHWSGIALAHLFSGDLDSAKQAIDRSLMDWPASAPALRWKAAICGLLGELDEGRDCVRRLLALNPDTTLASVQALNEPQMRHNLRGLRCLLEGLRKSGLPRGRQP
jgi:TolB-like protein/DNA-binding CsgD family transcriptional regulator